MSNLLLLFAALSVFSKNTLDQLKKAPKTPVSGQFGAPPPPPPPPSMPAAPTTTTVPKKKTETEKPAEPTKALTAVQIAQQKERVKFLNETLDMHQENIENFQQEFIDADSSTTLEKDVTRLLKNYTDFDDVRDFNFDNKKEVIQKLDNAIKETRQLLKDIKTPKKTVAPVEVTPTPTSGTVPPPPPPPMPTTFTGIKKTGISILNPAKVTHVKPKQPEKPAGIDLSGITDAKLKSRSGAGTAPSKSASLLAFEKSFDDLKITPGSMPNKLQKTRGQAILTDLKADIQGAIGIDRIQKQQLYNTMEPKFR